MAEGSDHYSVLGIPRDASDADIKRAYRQLVRTYHPDVSVDQIAAQEKFIQIVAAYQTLSDPMERAFYDQKLVHQQQRIEAERRKQFEESLRRETAESVLTTAEIYHFRGESDKALALCRRVLKTDPESASAYALVGDVYVDLGRFDDAAMAFTYAVQFAPENLLYQHKLERAVRKEPAPRDDADDAETPTAGGPERVSLFGICAGAVAVFMLIGSALYLHYLSRAGLAVFHDWFPPAPTIACGAICGGLAGFAMVLLLWLRRLDDDFFGASQDAVGSLSGAPTGLYVAIAGVASFYLAVIVYVLVSAFDEGLSWSMVRAFGAVALILAVLAAADWQHHTQTFMLGGNATFLAFLGGWALGSIGRRPW